MIMYIYGEDTWRSRQYLRQSIAQFKKTRDPQGYNAVVLDAKTVDSGRLLTELNSLPFLAEKRLLVLENLLSRSDDAALEYLLSKIKDSKIPESTVAIIWQGAALGKSKNVKTLSALLAKEKYAREFMPLSGANFSAWIKSESEARGGRIDPPAIAALSAAAADSWEANNLLNILLAYSGAQPITAEVVGLFTKAKLDDNVFSLVDAVARGDRKKALRLLEYQRSLGEEDGKIMGLIIWQYRILLQMADFLESDNSASSDMIAAKLGLHPFVVKKNLGLARVLPLSKLQKIYRQFLELEHQIKTGFAPRELLLDFFVAAA